MSRPDTVVAVTTDVQTCYRHGDRRAGVRCQRCDRPICPACMQQASVGFHCPECVKASGQRVHTMRTLQSANQAYVTMALVAANAAVYLVSTLGTGGTPLTSPSRLFENDWGLIGRIAASPLFVVGVADGEWYRIITGGFLHANLIHLAFNMFALWILGQQLEPAVGRITFAAVYVSSLIAGSLGVLLLDPGELTVGASGAVFGLFGYALVAQWTRGINPMDTGLGGIIFINLVFTFAFASVISVGGHLGGLVGGVLAGALVDIVRPQLRLPDWAGAVLVVVLGAACFAASLAVGSSL